MGVAKFFLGPRLQSGELPPRIGSTPATPLPPTDLAHDAWVVRRAAGLRQLAPTTALLTAVNMAEADWDVAHRGSEGSC